MKDKNKLVTRTRAVTKKGGSMPSSLPSEAVLPTPQSPFKTSYQKQNIINGSNPNSLTITPPQLQLLFDALDERNYLPIKKIQIFFKYSLMQVLFWRR